MKEKIAFVAARYGKEINGGAEQHCRMLAERLADQYDVEVLTTCQKNYRDGGSGFPEGEEMLGGVLVRRFAAAPVNPGQEHRYARKAKGWRRIRHLLYRMNVLPVLSSFIKVWKPGLKQDIEALRHSLFYSPGMVSFIRGNKDRYKVFIVFTVDYAPFYFTAVEAGEKTIAVPTLHNAKVSFRPALTEAFSRIRYTGFNTPAEQKLGQRIFGTALGDSGIIGCGIETPEAADWVFVKEKYSLPDRYLLYIGRVDGSKTGKILSYYGEYLRSAGAAAIPLVLAGGIYDRPEDMDGIILTGYVSEEEKRSILQHASLFINPSYYESLSLVVLEALNDNVPVLVNGHCEVLREHCERSGGAIHYYMDGKSFNAEIRSITGSPELQESMAVLGKEYFVKNYSWATVMERLTDAIRKVSGNRA